jgi:N12 class adenine-specific DNA methylase/2'-5' RNA ligase
MPLTDTPDSFVPDVPTPEEVEAELRAAAKAHGLDEDLALRVANRESRLTQSATSPKKARGVMQLMPETAKTLGVDPEDWQQNIQGGVKLLKSNLDYYKGDTRKALAAYNAGRGPVDKYNGVPPYKETQEYVDNILGKPVAPPPSFEPDPPSFEADQPVTIPGLLKPGNIDLTARPVHKNPDGTTSTVLSMRFGEDGKEILVPKVSEDGTWILSDEEAVDTYHKTGKHLGIFKDVPSANAYAQQLHEDYASGRIKLKTPGAADPPSFEADQPTALQVPAQIPSRAELATMGERLGVLRMTLDTQAEQMARNRAALEAEAQQFTPKTPPEQLAAFDQKVKLHNLDLAEFQNAVAGHAKDIEAYNAGTAAFNENLGRYDQAMKVPPGTQRTGLPGMPLTRMPVQVQPSGVLGLAKESLPWKIANTQAFKALGLPTTADAYDYSVEAAKKLVAKVLGEPSETTARKHPGVAATLTFGARVARLFPEVADFILTPAGTATAIATAVAPPAVVAGVGAAFSTDIALKANDAIEVARTNPTPENIGEAVKLSAMALLPFLRPAAELGRKVERGIEQHNVQAAQLVERERTQGLGKEWGQAILGEEPVRVEIAGKSHTIQALGGNPVAGSVRPRPTYQVVDDATGKAVYSGEAPAVQGYLEQQQAVRVGGLVTSVDQISAQLDTEYSKAVADRAVAQSVRDQIRQLQKFSPEQLKAEQAKGKVILDHEAELNQKGVAGLSETDLVEVQQHLQMVDDLLAGKPISDNFAEQAVKEADAHISEIQKKRAQLGAEGTKLPQAQRPAAPGPAAPAVIAKGTTVAGGKITVTEVKGGKVGFEKTMPGGQKIRGTMPIEAFRSQFLATSQPVQPQPTAQPKPRETEPTVPSPKPTFSLSEAEQAQYDQVAEFARTAGKPLTDKLLWEKLKIPRHEGAKILAVMKQQGALDQQGQPQALSPQPVVQPQPPGAKPAVSPLATPLPLNAAPVGQAYQGELAGDWSPYYRTMAEAQAAGAKNVQLGAAPEVWNGQKWAGAVSNDAKQQAQPQPPGAKPAVSPLATPLPSEPQTPALEALKRQMSDFYRRRVRVNDRTFVGGVYNPNRSEEERQSIDAQLEEIDSEARSVLSKVPQNDLPELMSADNRMRVLEGDNPLTRNDRGGPDWAAQEWLNRIVEVTPERAALSAPTSTPAPAGKQIAAPQPPAVRAPAPAETPASFEPDTLPRSLELEQKHGLSPAEAAVINHALDRLPQVRKDYSSAAEALQKEALRLAAPANVPLDKIANIKLLKRILADYLDPEQFRAAEAQNKEPWQMTREEFTAPVREDLARWNSSFDELRAKRGGTRGQTPAQALFDAKQKHEEGRKPYLERIAETEQLHERNIRRAVADGKPVPAAVLAEYPDLKPAQALDPDQVYRRAQAEMERRHLKQGLEQLIALDPDNPREDDLGVGNDLEDVTGNLQSIGFSRPEIQAVLEGRRQRLQAHREQSARAAEAIKPAMPGGVVYEAVGKAVGASRDKKDSQMFVWRTDSEKQGYEFLNALGNNLQYGHKDLPAAIRAVAEQNPDWTDLSKTALTALGREEVVSEKKPQVASPESQPKEKPTEYDFASTQVNLPPEIAQAMQEFNAQIPDEDLAVEAGAKYGGETAAKGREEQSHVTLLYGIKSENPDAVRKLLENQPPITLKLGKTSVFAGTDNGDVLKIDVESEDLERLNKLLKDNLEFTETHPGYKPHATLAYLKVGKGKEWSGKDVPGVTGKTVTLDRIAFSDKSGEQTSIQLKGEKPQTTPKPQPRETEPTVPSPKPASSLSEIPKPKAYTFANHKFMSAKDKQLTFKAWITFLRNGLQQKDFTKRLYEQLHQHMGFIAHYNINGFYEEYFLHGEDTERFIQHFDLADHRYGPDSTNGFWMNSDTAKDLNRAMVDEAAPYLPGLLEKAAAGQKAEDLAEAQRLQAKHGAPAPAPVVTHKLQGGGIVQELKSPELRFQKNDHVRWTDKDGNAKEGYVSRVEGHLVFIGTESDQKFGMFRPVMASKVELIEDEGDTPTPKRDEGVEGKQPQVASPRAPAKTEAPAKTGDIERQITEAESDLAAARKLYEGTEDGTLDQEEAIREMHQALAEVNRLQAEAAKENPLLTEQAEGRRQTMPPMPKGKESHWQQLMDDSSDLGATAGEEYVVDYGLWVERGKPAGKEPEKPNAERETSIDRGEYPKGWLRQAAAEFQTSFDKEVAKGLKEIEQETARNAAGAAADAARELEIRKAEIQDLAAKLREHASGDRTDLAERKRLVTAALDLKTGKKLNEDTDALWEQAIRPAIEAIRRAAVDKIEGKQITPDTPVWEMRPAQYLEHRREQALQIPKGSFLEREPGEWRTEFLVTLSKEELGVLLRLNGLPINGTKAMMVQRFQDARALRNQFEGKTAEQIEEEMTGAEIDRALEQLGAGKYGNKLTRAGTILGTIQSQRKKGESVLAEFNYQRAIYRAVGKGQPVPEEIQKKYGAFQTIEDVAAAIPEEGTAEPDKKIRIGDRVTWKGFDKVVRVGTVSHIRHHIENGRERNTLEIDGDDHGRYFPDDVDVTKVAAETRDEGGAGEATAGLRPQQAPAETPAEPTEYALSGDTYRFKNIIRAQLQGKWNGKEKVWIIPASQVEAARKLSKKIEVKPFGQVKTAPAQPPMDEQTASAVIQDLVKTISEAQEEVHFAQNDKDTDKGASTQANEAKLATAVKDLRSVVTEAKKYLDFPNAPESDREALRTQLYRAEQNLRGYERPGPSINQTIEAEKYVEKLTGPEQTYAAKYKDYWLGKIAEEPPYVGVHINPLRAEGIRTHLKHVLGKRVEVTGGPEATKPATETRVPKWGNLTELEAELLRGLNRPQPIGDLFDSIGQHWPDSEKIKVLHALDSHGLVKAIHGGGYERTEAGTVAIGKGPAEAYLPKGTAPAPAPKGSFKYEFQVHGEGGKWSDNALRFATEKEAQAAGDEHLTRWTMADAVRVVPSEDAPNYRWDDDQYKSVRLSGKEEGVQGEKPEVSPPEAPAPTVEEALAIIERKGSAHWEDTTIKVVPHPSVTGMVDTDGTSFSVEVTRNGERNIIEAAPLSLEDAQKKAARMLVERAKLPPLGKKQSIMEAEQPNAPGGIQQPVRSTGARPVEEQLPEGSRAPGEAGNAPQVGRVRDQAGGRGTRAGAGKRSELHPGGGSVPTRVGPATDVERSLPPRSRDVANNRHEHDFRIPDRRVISGSPETRAKANLAAIRLLREIQQDNRAATVEEQETLARYVGWGAVPQLFAGNTSEWKALQNDLRKSLSEEEYSLAQNSTKNAHYTGDEVVDAMWATLERMGATPGMNWLEPAVGVGNFFGRQPEALLAGSRRIGIDKDSLSAQIATLLYPDSGIQNQPFEEAELPKDYFDAAISNVPFADVKVHDPEFRNKIYLRSSVHNYFFAKTLGNVKPGGIVAFITSHYTMDAYGQEARAFRKWIASQADFLGAVRLPSNAFMQSSGTHVITDIVFLQKRLPNAAPAGEDWVETVNKTLSGQWGVYPVTTNAYYKRHPEHLLGEEKLKRGQFSDHDYFVEGELTPAALKKALSKIPGQFQQWQTGATAPRRIALREIRAESDKAKLGALFFDDKGDLFRKTSKGSAEPIPVSADAKQKIKGQLELRNAYAELLELERKDAPEAALDSARKRLNRMYDKYVAEHGPLSSRSNTELLKGDPDAPHVVSLERKWDPKTKTAEKSPIFKRRMLQPPKALEHTADAKDALYVSLNQTGRIDFERMEKLTGKGSTQLQSELKGIIYQDPTSREWEMADEYLSGAVRTKLRQAQAVAKLEPEFEENVKALEQVQPDDIPPAQIRVALGATWVPIDIYTEFATHILNSSTDTPVRYVANHWHVDEPYYSSARSKSQWDTGRMNAHQILEGSLNMTRLKVHDWDSDKKRDVINQPETAAAQAKQQELQTYFERWLLSTEAARTDQMVRLYNDAKNDLRLPTFDGSHLTLPEIVRDPQIVTGGDLAPHQKNAVWRGIKQRNVLLAHWVGTGKTFEGITIGMELKRLGLIQRPMYVVPNATLGGWQLQFNQLYPQKRVIVFSEKDLEKENRRATIARIAGGEWDAVVMPESSFRFIRTGDEIFNQHFQRLQEELDTSIQEAEGAGMDTRMIKRMEKMRDKLLTALQDKRNAERQDQTIIWEQLGIDWLFVDESHHYRKLGFSTKQQNIAGIDVNGNQMTFDLLMKMRHVQTTGRGVVFATGTPIVNTIGEMYSLMRYLIEPEMQARGIGRFDEWSADYARTVPVFEPKVEGGGYRMKDRFARIVNIPELANLFRSFADVVTNDMVDLKIPGLAGGERKSILTDLSDEQTQYLEEDLRPRGAAIRHNPRDAMPDNMLAVYTDAGKMALDIRTVMPHAKEDPGSRLNKAAEIIFRDWQDSAKTKGVQAIFCDWGKPNSARPLADRGQFSVYDELIRKLIKKGIPREQIATIYQAKGKDQRARLFQQVNEGTIRIILGSTKKLGEGVNIQERLYSLHHLDLPHTPSELDQREGRALRQGNTNPDVRVYYYMTRGSLDEMKFANVLRKAKFILAMMQGKATVREADDVGGMIPSLEMFQAATSGDPRVLRKMEVDAEVARLEAIHYAWRNQQWDERRQLADLPGRISRFETTISNSRSDIALRDAHLPGVWSVRGQTYEGKTPEAAKALAEYSNSRRREHDADLKTEMAKAIAEGGEDAKKVRALQNRAFTEAGKRFPPEIIAEYAGFKIRFDPIDGAMTIVGEGSAYGMERQDTATGTLASAAYFIHHHFEKAITSAEEDIARARRDEEQLQISVGKSWPYQKQFDNLVAEQETLTHDLGGDHGDPGAALLEDGEEIEDKRVEAEETAESGDEAQPEQPHPTTPNPPTPGRRPGAATQSRRSSQAGAASLDLLTLGAPKFIQEDVAPALGRVAQNFVAVKNEIFTIIAPAARGPAAKQTALSVRYRAAELAQKTDRALAALKETRRYFDSLPEWNRLEFMDRIENGQQQIYPQEDAIAEVFREMLDGRRQDVQDLGTGKLENWIENYFPHIWEDPEKATKFAADWLAKRPFEGKKAFLKKRKIPTIQEGMNAGLVPVSTNPVDLVLMKVREMDKYIMAHKALGDLKDMGFLPFVSSFDKLPEGHKWIDDRVATVFGPPTVTVKEAFDQQLSDRLNQLADALGIKHERKVQIGGQRSGYAEKASGKVVTRFASPESVLIHEIGHQLEWKYNLLSLLKDRDFPERTKELRALADLRYEGDPDVAESFKKYVRRKDEKIANAVMAVLYAPEKVKAVAPNTWDFLRDELWHIPALRPLFDIKPSLVLGARTAEVPVGGLVIIGRYAAPEPAARVLNNYLSPGLRDRSMLFRSYLGAANVLNQFQLGWSAFHLGFTSMDAAVSKFGLGIYQLAHGHPLEALGSMALTPVAPFTNILHGDKILKEWDHPGTQSAQIAELVDAMVQAGGRAHMDKFYETQISKRMTNTMRGALQAWQGGNWVGAGARIVGAGLQLPFALTEQASRPIMEWLVPRQKMGVFADMARFELDRLGNNATEQDKRAALAKAWDSVDNRMGQLVYDNLFWNKVTKDLAMGSIRSVGWNVGTIRELVGGAGDTVVALGGALGGKKPEMTWRMSYLIALPIVVGILGAILYYLFNGKAPENLRDVYAPRTGLKDKSGMPERLMLPSYMKDVIHYTKEPVRTATNKIHPLLTLIADTLTNEDFAHRKIRDPKDPLEKQLVELADHVATQFVPMAWRGWVDPGKRRPQANWTEEYLPFVGITPAPKAIKEGGNQPATAAPNLRRMLSAPASGYRGGSLKQLGRPAGY